VSLSVSRTKVCHQRKPQIRNRNLQAATQLADRQLADRPCLFSRSGISVTVVRKRRARNANSGRRQPGCNLIAVSSRNLRGLVEKLRFLFIAFTLTISVNKNSSRAAADTYLGRLSNGAGYGPAARARGEGSQCLAAKTEVGYIRLRRLLMRIKELCQLGFVIGLVTKERTKRHRSEWCCLSCFR
jgi:hypothetical protein